MTNLKDRRIVVTIIPSEGVRSRPWFSSPPFAASRSAGFLLDDLGVDPQRLTVGATAPRPQGRGGKGEKIEFSFEPV